jgi:hypothetical protein
MLHSPLSSHPQLFRHPDTRHLRRGEQIMKRLIMPSSAVTTIDVLSCLFGKKDIFELDISL